MSMPRVKPCAGGAGDRHAGPLSATVLLLLVGCAAGTPVGFQSEGQGLHRPRAVPRNSRDAERPRVAEEGTRSAAPPAPAPAPSTPAPREYQEFLQHQRERLSGLSEAERQEEDAVLRELEWWLWRHEEELARRPPVEVYSELKGARASAARAEAARRAAVERKLEEYWRWAEALWGHTARMRFRPVGRARLLTNSPEWEAAQDTLVSAVLTWGASHTEDPDFLRKGPSEVALYLLATRSALASAVTLGHLGHAHLDDTPMREKTLEEEEEDETRELLVGLIPLVGDTADFAGLVTGYSVTGRRQLSASERLLCAVTVVLPLFSTKALGKGAEAVERVALSTGRSLEEARVLMRVAEHVAPEEARELQNLLRSAARNGGRFTEEEAARLAQQARRLEGPLNELRAALKRGERVPFLGVRTDAEGARLLPGSPEHMTQAWIDYQFRHSEKFPRFILAPDEAWQKLYRTVLENKGKGSEFEQAVLQKLGHEKNSALMLPPLERKAQGFIPDAVVGNANPGELVWGKPYHFVEAKARNELALTGNLEAMLDYVRDHGGHIELWLRSARHPSGATRLTGPLQKRLNALRDIGRALVRYYP